MEMQKKPGVTPVMVIVFMLHVLASAALLVFTIFVARLAFLLDGAVKDYSVSFLGMFAFLFAVGMAALLVAAALVLVLVLVPTVVWSILMFRRMPAFRVAYTVHIILEALAVSVYSLSAEITALSVAVVFIAMGLALASSAYMFRAKKVAAYVGLGGNTVL